MKRRLIQFLLWLTEMPHAPRPGAQTEEFLAGAWLHDGFRSYLAARERALEKYLSRNVNGAAINREEYLIAQGQLHELDNLMNTAKRCFEAKKQKMQAKNNARMV